MADTAIVLTPPARERLGHDDVERVRGIRRIER